MFKRVWQGFNRENVLEKNIKTEKIKRKTKEKMRGRSEMQMGSSGGARIVFNWVKT